MIVNIILFGLQNIEKVLSGEVGKHVRTLIRQIYNSDDFEILRGHVSRDHVHLFVSAPPHLAISKLVQSLKGKSSYKLMQEGKHISRFFGVVMFRHEVIV